MPKDANDPFLNGLSFNTEGGDALPAVYPILTTTDSFYATFSSFDGVGMTQTWVYYANPALITTDNMGDVADDVITFRSHVTGAIQDTPGSPAC